MKNRYGWEVGDVGIVTVDTGGIFSEGSIIQLERDDVSRSPLWKLLHGYCRHNLTKDNKPGSYCHYNDVLKLSDSGYFKDWERPTQEEMAYFEMITGYKVPWSKDKPLIL